MLHLNREDVIYHAVCVHRLPLFVQNCSSKLCLVKATLIPTSRFSFPFLTRIPINQAYIVSAGLCTFFIFPPLQQKITQPARESIRLRRHRRVFCPLFLDLRFACAPILFWDLVHYHWDVLAAAPPGGLFCEGSLVRKKSWEEGRGVRQVAQVPDLHILVGTARLTGE